MLRKQDKADYRWQEMVMKSCDKGQRGQGMVEYALIFALVVLVVIIILALFGPGLVNIFSNIILPRV
jgi:Flp pilus assembly pilin Flp